MNDYVPFYFSPITAFTYTIAEQNVELVAPDGTVLRKACEDDRIFFVARPESFRRSGIFYCFSDSALNSNAPVPTVETNLDRLEDHVCWRVFDEAHDKARIPEIGYPGVNRWFHSMASPAFRMSRSPQRMAEFLVFGAVPLNYIDCIVVKTDEMRDKLQVMMAASTWGIPIYTKPGCYYK